MVMSIEWMSKIILLDRSENEIRHKFSFNNIQRWCIILQNSGLTIKVSNRLKPVYV